MPNFAPKGKSPYIRDIIDGLFDMVEAIKYKVSSVVKLDRSAPSGKGKLGRCA